jgi:hypothetical protein
VLLKKAARTRAPVRLLMSVAVALQMVRAKNTAEASTKEGLVPNT